MTHPESLFSPSESRLREQLATYFLSVPAPGDQTPAQQKIYWENLRKLGQLEEKELRQAAGNNRPLVWGNPATLLQALLSATQRLGARLGQPLLLFPAKDTAIGTDTLIHPRMLSVTVAALLREACRVAGGQPVWVRLQEQKGGLSMALTAPQPFWDAHGEILAKECTRLHGGSLVHSDSTLILTCGQELCPPPGTHLYVSPTEEDLLRDSLSPVWSVFYAGLYSSSSSSSRETNVADAAENSSSATSAN